MDGIGRYLCLFVLAAVLVVPACGFQLRGAAELPEAMARTHISQADPTTRFARSLDRQLRANGVEVLEDEAGATATLEVSEARMTRRPLTVSGTAQVREYELVFVLIYRLVDQDGDTLLPEDRIVLERSYSFDEQEILGARREEEFLRDELSDAMVAQLIRRLEAGP